MKASTSTLIKQKHSCPIISTTKYSFLVLLVFFLSYVLASLFNSLSFSNTSDSRAFLNQYREAINKNTNDNETKTLISKLRDSVTFLPLKDLRFERTALDGNTWFMSTLNDTYIKNETQYIYFPSQTSKGRLLCLKVSNISDENYYALAWSESLPESAVLLKGLSFISSTYYEFSNLWHGLGALAPFVGWSLKKGCLQPRRWVLFQQCGLKTTTGSWLKKVMGANFGELPIESFEYGGKVPYCFQKALVMRHDLGKMVMEKRFETFQQIRCKARSVCGINPKGKGRELNENGVPIIRLTLLMRRGTRAFKDPQAVTEIFGEECEKVEGCILKVVQSEKLSFCEQVKEMAYTDIVASPHGAQLTNMIFLDQNSSVMEFFPKGWLELAGQGQYAHHWLAASAGMKHQGAWWDKLDKKECAHPEEDIKCFDAYKDGNIGHNKTYFASWARNVLNQVKHSKQATQNTDTAAAPGQRRIPTVHPPSPPLSRAKGHCFVIIQRLRRQHEIQPFRIVFHEFIVRSGGQRLLEFSNGCGAK
ncbi:hypothetical protein Nepgr_024281 [Nepenthes gracilis]|uniref:Glycosyltransferase 61 catalytic domain-containing protein n=1 Tax=Nepenthes gracilis TaxID=150966 RepID=A0AAD3XYN1_NEPGR|nr:hypothetical protein Nepgr_024281 [Nepenthes gracilis]